MVEIPPTGWEAFTPADWRRYGEQLGEELAAEFRAILQPLSARLAALHAATGQTIIPPATVSTALRKAANEWDRGVGTPSRAQRRQHRRHR